MAERLRTEWIVFHHTANARAHSVDQRYNELVEEGKRRLESYSIVILLDWEKKKAIVKDMPWARSKVTNHAFGCSMISMGISVDANFENDPFDPWIENEVKFALLSLFLDRDEMKPTGKDGKHPYTWPDLSVKRIIAHRDCIRFSKKNATACNGRNFYAAMPRIVAWLEGELRKRGELR